MDTRTVVLVGQVAFGVIVLIVFFCIVLYSLRLQRKAMGTQDSAVSTMDESLALYRESVHLQKQGLALAEESQARQKEALALQKETNRLLATLANERK